METMSPVVLSGIASIIDEHGYFSVVKTNRGRKVTIQSSIVVTMRDRAFLDMLFCATGVGRVTKSSHPFWKWYISPREIIPFLEQVKPYLRGKKERANLMIELELLKKKSKPSLNGAYCIEHQLALCEEIQRMNKDGEE